MRDPETNEPAIAEIWRGSELFTGKYADRAPDLFFFTRDMKYKAMGLTDFGSNKVFDDLYGTHAHHRMNGLFILRGPSVRQGEQIQGARLIDLAPTIYSLMGVPIPQDLDGQPLRQVFAPDYEIVPEYESGPVDHFIKPDVEQVYSLEEEALLAQHLRNLGYVD
jgi:predicted AlkP superfamily phosphohydrolase/phosphomutase